MNDKEQKLFELIAEHLDVPIQKVTETATLDGLGADSLDKVELILACEDAFGFDVPEEVAQAWTTVGDLRNYFVAGMRP